MQISKSVMENLTEDAGYERTQKAKKYQKQQKVEIEYKDYIDENNFEIKAKVYGMEEYKVYVLVEKGEIEDITCTCEDYERHYGVCKHSLAAVLELQNTENKNKKQIEEYIEKDLTNTKKQKSETKYRTFRQIVNSIYNEELENLQQEINEKQIEKQGKIKIEPKIIYDRYTKNIKIEFKLGNKRMYKLKNLREFYERMLNNTIYRYGNQLEFIHKKENFEEKSQELLEFILKHAEIIKYANQNTNNSYYGKQLNETNITITNSGIDDLFEVMKGKICEFENNYLEETLEFMEKDPQIEFQLEKTKKDEYSITTNIDIYKLTKIKGRKYQYILYENKLYKLSKEFEQTKLRLIQIFKDNYITSLELEEKDLQDFFAIIMPKINNKIQLANVRRRRIRKI